MARNTLKSNYLAPLGLKALRHNNEKFNFKKLKQIKQIEWITRGLAQGQEHQKQNCNTGWQQTVSETGKLFCERHQLQHSAADWIRTHKSSADKATELRILSRLAGNETP